MCFGKQSDRIYRRFVLSKFFSKGWGDIRVFKDLLEARKVIVDRTKSNILISDRYPVEIHKTCNKESYCIAEGHFTSPLAQHFSGLLPKESEKAHFQILVPRKWPKDGGKPICLHLAGTGDHYFWRRRNFMAKPLIKESGIASILLENPYYGLRKPKDQLRSSLNHVVDLFIMGAALILESLVLLHWCEREGFGPLAITGISMGGHMASLACTAWPKPLGIVPCLSWSTASSVFTQGVLKRACSWNTLEQQLSNEDYMKNLLDFMPVNRNASSNTSIDNGGNYPYSNHVVGHSSISALPVFNSRHSNADESGSHTLCLHEEDIYNGLKTSALEFLPSFIKNSKIQENAMPKPSTVDFMNYVMDKATHLTNFPIPVEPSLARFVVAEHDGYVPRDNVMNPCDIWPGCTVEYVTGGHVAASLKHQNIFRRVIRETLAQLT